VSLAELDGARLALAINLELSHGRHGAAARVEVLDRGGRRVARLGLSGWVEGVAMSRLERTVSELSERAPDGLILDCSRVRDVDHHSLPRLVRALAPFAERRDGLEVLGLTQRLRERFLWTQDAARAARAASSPVAVPAAGNREWTT
jgi:hypothetical protein